MTLFIDTEYVSLVSSRLRNFKKKRDSLWNFSCPICGDSKKDRSKARGFIYRRGNHLFYKCYNCSSGLNFANFLKEVDSVLYDDYIVSRYKTGNDKNIKKKEVERVLDFKAPIFKSKTTPVADCPTIFSLDDIHPAKVYVTNRKIPESYWSRMHWTEDFRSVAMKMDDKYAKLKHNDARIVLPFYDTDGSLLALQGRTINPDEKIRYITVKSNEDSTKVYGLDLVDVSKDIFVVEGLIDSMFLPNSLAAACSDLRSVEGFVPKDNCILIPDREPRNKEICKLIAGYIKAGWRVCLMPDSLISKDINDYILKDGKSAEEVVEIINSHTYNGMSAELEFSDWKKV